MHKFLLTAAFLAGITTGAQAQLLNIQVNNKDPLTGLPPDQWITLVTHIVNAAPLIGKDSIYVVNATNEDILSVTCGKYQLAGPKPYITNNPATAAPFTLPKWTVSLLPTEGFNTYCKDGIQAQGSVGSYRATLSAGNFQNSTFIIVKPGS